MAITSVGYDGTVDEAQWASMVSKVGSYEYGVDGAGDFSVTQVAGTRMLSVAGGIAWGRGVMDLSDDTQIIQLEPVSTGSRWDLIALRRTWGPLSGGPTELVVIKGTSSKQIPSGRQNTPGVVDDQPIALIRVQAGLSGIPEMIDLRVWGRNGGQLYAKDDLVRSYISAVGTEINIDGILWQRIVGSNGTAAWVEHGQRSDTGWKSTTSGAASGWKVGYINYRAKDDLVELIVSVERTGGSITPSDSGDIPNYVVATVPQAAAPQYWWHTLSSGPSGRTASGSIGAGSGEVTLQSVAGTAPIIRGDVIQLGGMYFKK